MFEWEQPFLFVLFTKDGRFVFVCSAIYYVPEFITSHGTMILLLFRFQKPNGNIMQS